MSEDTETVSTPSPAVAVAAGMTADDLIGQWVDQVEDKEKDDEVVEEAEAVETGDDDKGEGEAGEQSADEGADHEGAAAGEGAPEVAAVLGEPGKKATGAEKATDEGAHERSERSTSGDGGAPSELPGEGFYGVSEESEAESPGEDNQGREDRAEPAVETLRGAEAGKGNEEEEVEEKQDDKEKDNRGKGQKETT